MNCPACQRTLVTMKANNMEVDVCQKGCGGVFFDNFELKKVDEPHEDASAILNVVEPDASIRVDHSQKRNCPKCDGQVMMRHFFSVKREIEVDECPTCAGHWLDVGELAKIRSQYHSEDERKAAANRLFSELFDGEIKAMHAKGEKHRENAKRIANQFRLICPSYWLPDDQDGGAF